MLYHCRWVNQVVRNLKQPILCNVIHPMVKTWDVLGQVRDLSEIPLLGVAAADSIMMRDQIISTPIPTWAQGYDNALQGNSQMNDAV